MYYGQDGGKKKKVPAVNYFVKTAYVGCFHTTE